MENSISILKRGSVASFREIVSSNFFPPSPSAVVQGAVNPLAYWRSANWGKGRGSKLWNGKRKENDGGSAVRTNKRNWKEREKKRERRERGTEFERTGWDRDDRKRGWPRLPWRPSQLKWTHTLSRYACLEGTLSSLLPPSPSSHRPLRRPSSPLLETEGEANGIMLNPRRGKFATRRVSTCRISREISTTSRSMGTFSFRSRKREYRNTDLVLNI